MSTYQQLMADGLAGQASRLTGIAARPCDPVRLAGFLSGAIPTLPATAGPTISRRHMDGHGPHGERARQARVYDRAKSRQRKRMMGGDGRLPNTLRHWFTEGERAVLSVIADEVKRRGACELHVERIAAKAGVSIRTTQYALATASWRGADIQSLKESDRPPLLIVVEKPRGRQRADRLPNRIRIVSREWISWLSYRPSEAPAIEAAEGGRWNVFDAWAGCLPRLPGLAGTGCKEVHTSETPISREVEKGPFERNREGERSAQRVERGSGGWSTPRTPRHDETWRRLG